MSRHAEVRSWPRVDVALTFFSAQLTVDEMTEIAGLVPDIAAPAFFTRWGSSTERPTSIYGLAESLDSVDDVGAVVERLIARAVAAQGIVALGQRSDDAVLSIAFYLLEASEGCPAVEINGQIVLFLSDLGINIHLAVYRG